MEPRFEKIFPTEEHKPEDNLFSFFSLVPTRVFSAVQWSWATHSQSLSRRGGKGEGEKRG